jgi:hypothetical protein
VDCVARIGAMPNKDQPSPEKEDDSEIPRIIKHFTFQVRAIRDCAIEHIKMADDNTESWLKKIKQSVTVTKEDDAETRTVTFSFAGVQEFEEFYIRSHTPRPEILSQSLMIFGFAAFDAFLGILLRQLYKEVPSLIYLVEDKSIKVGDLAQCKTIDQAIDHIIDRDISALLRDSYSEQFSELANRHGISTLKKFDSWPTFAEAAQRRNLITHCNGLVNANYIDNCKRDGVPLSADVVVGKKLRVSADYLRDTLDVLYEVGVKLAHLLWRKASPSHVKESESILTDELFELLIREEWGVAKKLGEFAITLPGPVVDRQIRVSRINYAQALKWSGDDAGARKVLDAVDWSSSIRDLRLGVEVLRENYDDAAKLMREIGRQGEIVEENGYREWPVFRQFRKTKEFADAFRDVFGTDYAEVDKSGSNQSNDVGVSPQPINGSGNGEASSQSTEQNLCLPNPPSTSQQPKRQRRSRKPKPNGQ